MPVSITNRTLVLNAVRRACGAPNARRGRMLAVATATMAFTGLRPGEVLALQARDVNDGGAVLWVPGTKNEGGQAPNPVDAEFQTVPLGAATGKGAGQVLFDHQPQRKRASKDARKTRLDALL